VEKGEVKDASKLLDGTSWWKRSSPLRGGRRGFGSYRRCEYCRYSLQAGTWVCKSRVWTSICQTSAMRLRVVSTVLMSPCRCLAPMSGTSCSNLTHSLVPLEARLSTLQCINIRCFLSTMSKVEKQSPGGRGLLKTTRHANGRTVTSFLSSVIVSDFVLLCQNTR
jgi:hypothetical protein